jgi:hypothetical protein
MWIEYEVYNFAKCTVEKRKRWIDVNQMVSRNAFLSRAIAKHRDSSMTAPPDNTPRSPS